MWISDKSTIDDSRLQKPSTHDTVSGLLQCGLRRYNHYIVILVVIYCYFFQFSVRVWTVRFLPVRVCVRFTIALRHLKQQCLVNHNRFDNLLIYRLLMCEMLLFEPLEKCLIYVNSVQVPISRCLSVLFCLVLSSSLSFCMPCKIVNKWNYWAPVQVQVQMRKILIWTFHSHIRSEMEWVSFNEIHENRSNSIMKTKNRRPSAPY